LQRTQEFVRDLGARQRVGEALARVALHAQQQVRGGLGVGQGAVGAAGVGQAVQRRQRAQAVVGGLRVEPARQQQGAGEAVRGVGRRGPA
jgi:hypothetical protein